jgi:hypothetical protein
MRNNSGIIPGQISPRLELRRFLDHEAMYQALTASSARGQIFVVMHVSVCIPSDGQTLVEQAVR